ncbi:phage tail sheath subtilisin-like domain-containing protein [Xanthomonas graminis]|uniref:phage tail sheath subtilisin-like domain-containing protein n=1 Tax=Xanthomonas graminis TaxID=3390026 RepID=UPI001F2985DC|nr:phage tail sheath subtilisin-like domain-containing protein [Xanthomonas translucens]UKE73223.1 phage tail sheath subtilisin-like domain-containing protein [Xanthomonas translucens pv. phleipratensis]
MSNTYHHGVRVLEVSAGTRAIRTIATAVLGLVATAADADAATFPLNKPVLITDVLGAIAKAGSDGTLRTALQAIANQCNPVAVVVRVEKGADPATTTSNVVGQSAPSGYTGLQALLAAQAQLGVRPRIIGAPGLDNQAVVAAMGIVAAKLRGMAYARAVGGTVAEVITYRAQFSAREIMLIWPDFTAWDTATSATAEIYATACAMGLRAKIDQEQGWHKSLSNVPVAGVTGISRDVHWDLQSPGTDAGLLNEGDITTLVNFTGYRFWGSRTCAEDEAFAFETATRTAQILADTIAEGVAFYVDKPMHPSLVKDLLESINAKFRDLKAAGYIIDAEAYYDASVNSSQTLSLGELQINYDYTPVPPLENLQLNQKITSSYLDNFADRINA